MSNTIDLSGSQGNAFSLMANAKEILRQLGKRDEFDEIQKQMMSGDYNNLIRVFEKNFGDYVTLINTPDEEQDDDRLYT